MDPGTTEYFILFEKYRNNDLDIALLNSFNSDVLRDSVIMFWYYYYFYY